MTKIIGRQTISMLIGSQNQDGWGYTPSKLFVYTGENNGSKWSKRVSKIGRESTE